ncbi:MAG: DNA translocase FtsK, partial [Calditrichota bacterium]
MSEKQNKTKKEKTTSQPEKPHKSSKSLEVLHIVLFFFAIILTLSLIWFNPYEGPGAVAAGRSAGPIGQVGNQLAGFVIQTTFGRWGALAIPMAIFLLLIGWWSGGRFKPWRWIFAVILLGFYAGLTIALVNIAQNGLPSADASGLPALALVELGITHLRLVGTSLVLLALAFIFAVLIADVRPSLLLSTLFYHFPKILGHSVASIFKSRNKLDKALVLKKSEAPAADALVDAEDESRENDDSESDLQGDDGAESPESTERPSAKPGGFRLPLGFRENLSARNAPANGARMRPPIELLDEPPPGRPTVSQAELDENSRRLEDKLRNLGVQAKVIRTLPGPVITRYDLEPAAEVKIARIASLADDIAMALKAPAVRILAPIPGEAAVGIEIPNRHPATVYMREVVASEDFRRGDSPLIIALGKDAGGRIFCTDLARMPHLLIAGATGSGKSVC